MTSCASAGEPSVFGIRYVWILFASILITAFAACAGASPVDPAREAREMSRLLKPYREDQSLIASELEIRMTGNFYSMLAKGVTETMHETSVEQRGGHTIYEYRPKARVVGAPPMEFRLENTRFYVEGMMRVIVLGGAQKFTLDTRAANVAIVRGDNTANMRKVEIRDGAFQQ